MAVVFGLEVKDLPAGWVPLKVVVIVEAADMTDTNDERKLHTAVSERVTYWDVMGMTDAAHADAYQQYVNAPDVEE